MRWLLFPSLLTLAACSAQPRFTTLLDCAPDEDLDVEARIAEVDFDGDGLLTAADLDQVGVVAVLSWAGTSGPHGTSVHSGVEAQLRYGSSDTWDPVWAFALPLDGCEPRASMGFSFFGEDRNPTWLQEGLGDLHSATVTPVDYEMTSTWEGEAQIRLTDVQTDTASGHMEGSAVVTLRSLMTPFEPTGQTVVVEALAFRDLPAETNLRAP